MLLPGYVATIALHRACYSKIMRWMYNMVAVRMARHRRLTETILVRRLGGAEGIDNGKHPDFCAFL